MQFQSEKDILTELNTFISGATQTSKSNPLDLSKTALNLLKTLPTARDAILEYFCTVFDIAVNNYIVRIETEIATGQLPSTSSREEATVSEIHTVLCSFVSSNPQAWAPIISTWSLELLGELSSRYAGRAHVSVQASLNETLQLWMGARSTRTLIDITTQCLTCLMDAHTENSESWMNALLDTSVKHSPNFDWVVAHVGNCFPNTVITRVLSCGLKDFSMHKTSDTGRKSPKLLSVVGILGHLAGSHFNDIRAALLQLFAWSLKPFNMLDTDLKSQKVATVPFLLQLAALSSTLLNALTTNISHTLKQCVILRLCAYTNDWCKYFGSAKILQELIVKLILDSERDGIQVVNLLLNFVHMSDVDENVSFIREHCRETLEYVLQDIDYIVRTENSTNVDNVRLLNSLSKDIGGLHSLLLSSERLKFETATRIIMLMGKFNHIVTLKSCCYLLRRSRSYDNLVMLVRLLGNQNLCSKNETSFGYVDNFGEILKQTLLEISDTESSDSEYWSADQMWQNLLILLKWEKSAQIFALKSKPISQAILTNLKRISHEFGNAKNDNKIRHIIAELLHITIVSIPINNLNFSPHIIFSLVNANVNYFFLCCQEPNAVLKVKGNRIVCDLFNCLTLYSKSGRVNALRELLERSLFKKESILFGAKLPDDYKEGNDQDLLLYKNHKHSTTMMLTHRHSSVFHSGIIGHGKRKPQFTNPYSAEELKHNVAHLLLAVKSCCISFPDDPNDPLKKSPISLEALTLVSLLLVQFVSPDVMYNGLPWPEEEFSKVTIERDLYIRRLFANTPILWNFLRFIAAYRPVLCYCSVLLRAICATLLHQWNSTGQGAGSYNKYDLIDTTLWLLDIMSMGQLLPPPLASLRIPIEVLRPNEIVQLLRFCVWNYIRDHVPSPALFGCDASGLHWRDPSIARPGQIYTDTFRAVMYKNIDKLGQIYAQLFLDIPDTE